jgi:hypothetical protein
MRDVTSAREVLEPIHQSKLRHVSSNWRNFMRRLANRPINCYIRGEHSQQKRPCSLQSTWRSIRSVPWLSVTTFEVSVHSSRADKDRQSCYRSKEISAAARWEAGGLFVITAPCSELQWREPDTVQWVQGVVHPSRTQSSTPTPHAPSLPLCLLSISLAIMHVQFQASVQLGSFY